MPLRVPAQETRIGPEFQVNTHTTDSQRVPSVAASASGDFVVAWQSIGQDGSFYGVFARRFSSAGAPLGVEFQVNTYTSGNQEGLAVATYANGDFVIAWRDFDGSGTGVFGRRFSSAGVPLAAEFQVNTYTIDKQGVPSVAASATGDFVVVWSSPGQDGSAEGVFAQRFSSAGTPLAAELQVNTYTTDGQHSPAVAADSDGDFVVVWQSYGQDGSAQGVFVQRFSSAGTPLAAELQGNSYTTYNQSRPAVAVDTDGDFVVAWQSDASPSGQDGSQAGVFARRFSSAGTPLAEEFQVNTFTLDYQGVPAVAAAAGDFVVAWSSYHQDRSYRGVFARHFSSAGSPLATEFQVNAYTYKAQAFPAVTASASGDLVFAWQSDLQDGSAEGIFAQRFAVPKVLDIDADGSVGALTDGLLVLRYLFGFTGSTLVTGAVGDGCARCDADAIGTYLATLF